MEIRLTLKLFLFFVFSSIFVNAQQTITEEIVINWQKDTLFPSPDNKSGLEIISFNGAKIIDAHPQLPVYSTIIPIPSFGSLDIKIRNAQYEEISLDLKAESKKFLSNIPKVYSQIMENKRNFFGGINLLPYRWNNGQLEILVKATLEAHFKPSATGPQISSQKRMDQSVLADGQIFKLSIPSRGIYKIDHAFISNTLGLNISTINPGLISFWSHPGGPLPEANIDPRVDDLEELPSRSFGLNDGIFQEEDYMLIYAEGPDSWAYDEKSKQYTFTKNIYDIHNYVFLKIGQAPVKTLSLQENLDSYEYQSQDSDEYIRHEMESVNLLGNYGSAQGSGQRWFGEEFTNLREQLFSNNLSFQDIDLNEPVTYWMEFAGRSDVSSEVELIIDDQSYRKSISSVKTGDVEARYARIASFQGEQMLNSSNPLVKINFNAGTAEAWLDFIQFSYRRDLQMTEDLLLFRDLKSLSYDHSSFLIKNASADTEIWDISNPLSPKLQQVAKSGSEIEFNFASANFREFLAINTSAKHPNPGFVEEIANQNLHSISDLDMLIVYPPEFEEAAQRLANHRRATNNFIVEAKSTAEIYNEFSSGKKDPSALRDFARLLYTKSSRFNYLLLLGDGSYDVRNITPGLADHNFVLTFETKNSLEPLKAFPTDDYFALLGLNEGDDLRGALDIAVGRLPVKTIEEANAIVDKIIHYETSPDGLGDWKQRIAFTADDEDSNIHINDADGIAKRVSAKHKVFNQEKIYFDAFQQVSTPGGDRYPEAEKKINDEIFKGLLVLNYLGHGGPKGWSQERVLKISDLNSWDNYNAMSLLITATCSFTGFDDPALQTAGESAILNEKGGAIALFSTVRAVYASQNERLTRAVFDTIFTKPENKVIPIGEILRRSKNANSADTININARKFLLIGDPALRLNLPRYEVSTSKINGKEIGASTPDTLRALQKVTVEGFINDESGAILSGFQGTIYPTVFDKPTEIQTLQNDQASLSKKFNVQRNILFKGAASVVNGQFSFSFVVPTDINYTFGQGKISYYASDGQQDDAGGYYDGIIVGGTDSNALLDNESPKVDLFMNTVEFVSGGITDANPILLAHISDENGINVSGTSIGHDLTGTLDENTQNTYILNEFYTSDIDDFTSGKLRFPLNDLEIGKHSIRVKAFDVANNPGEGYLEFIVTNGEDAALEHVLNYPNPFTSHTRFMFEHDLANTSLDVLVYIYTVSGKLVKTIEAEKYSTGFRINDIEWDGRDDYGSQLAKGIYLYKIKVGSDELNLSRESEFEKLVILK